MTIEAIVTRNVQIGSGDILSDVLDLRNSSKVTIGFPIVTSGDVYLQVGTGINSTDLSGRLWDPRSHMAWTAQILAGSLALILPEHAWPYARIEFDSSQGSVRSLQVVMTR